MIRVSAVSYLNTKPFLKGLEKNGLLSKMDLWLEIPSKTAEKLKNGLVDLALVPVATLAELPNYHLVSNYCIGAVGAVKTVALYSQVPMEQITHILLDYHSRTSVALVQVLCKHFWHKQVTFLPAAMGFENQIEGTTAGVIIGDRTIEWAKHFAYQYDLSQAWQQMTNLPFVFAVWVSLKPLPDYWIQQLNQAFAVGINSIDEVVDEYKNIYPPHFDIKEYLTHYISYDLTPEKQTAMNLFLGYVDALKTIPVV